MTIVQYVLVFLACVAIAIADPMLKYLGIHSNLSSGMKATLWSGVGLLYMFQIGIFYWVFKTKGELLQVVIMQTVVYAVIGVVASVVLFHEPTSSVRVIGAVIAILAVVVVYIGK